MTYIVFCLLFVGSVVNAQVTCRAVSAGGSGNGLSWSTPMAAPSGTSWTRGIRYYLADGSYGTNLSVTTADSGTTRIELRKAQSYDFGRAADGCSNDISAGWDTGTMGSGQAVWQSTAAGNSWGNINANYITLNGNSNQAAGTVGCGGVYANPPANMTLGPPTPAGCGIKLNNATCTATTTNACSSGGVPPINIGHDVTFQNTELQGVGVPGFETGLIAVGRISSVGSLTVTGSYWHDAGAVFLLGFSGGYNGFVFSFNYVWGVGRGEAISGINHPEAIMLQGTSNSANNPNMVVHHNIFRDQEFTDGEVVAVTGGGTQTNLWFYDNVDFCSPGVTCDHNNQGILGCFNGQICTGWQYINNTVVGLTGGCGTNLSSGGGTGSITIENNLFYNCNAVTFNSSSKTVDYNSYLNSNTAAQGTHDVSSSSATCPGANCPFTNYSSGLTGPAVLTGDNALWNNRNTALGSPFDADILGNTYSTSTNCLPGTAVCGDRGAYQFVATGPSVSPAGPFTWTNTQSVNSGTSGGTLTAAGFAGTVTWSKVTGCGVLCGNLPTGIVNTAGSCQVGTTTGTTCTNTGTLTAAGTFDFTIRATDGTSTVDAQYAATVNAVVSGGNCGGGGATCPGGTQSISYRSQTITWTAGTTPITCASSDLPAGITLSSSCILGGVPSAAGTFTFHVTPTDANSVSGSLTAFTITIAPNTAITVVNVSACTGGPTLPGTCTITTPAVGNLLVVAYGSYSSAGATCPGAVPTGCSMTSITDNGASGGDVWSEITGTYATCNSTLCTGSGSWTDLWSTVVSKSGVTTLTVTPNSTQRGNVYVLEIANANAVNGVPAALSDQAASATPSGAAMTTTIPAAIVVSFLHPSPAGQPTGPVSPFVDASHADGMALSYRILATTNTVTPQWNQTSAGFSASSAAFAATTPLRSSRTSIRCAGCQF